jgi:SAM-dependent methyltransferase
VSAGGQEHWDAIYGETPVAEVSWYEAFPETSLRLIASAGGSAVLDVGAGASFLADRLLEHGYADLTLLDVSNEALSVVQQRLGDVQGVEFVVADLLAWQPTRRFDVWHDRAVLHFLTGAADVRRYVATAANAVRDGGAVVVGTFAGDGPTRCSGLPTARYEPDALAALFEPAFTEVHHEREEHRTPGGLIQPFTWVVLRRR